MFPAVVSLFWRVAAGFLALFSAHFLLPEHPDQCLSFADFGLKERVRKDFVLFVVGSMFFIGGPVIQLIYAVLRGGRKQGPWG